MNDLLYHRNIFILDRTNGSYVVTFLPGIEMVTPQYTFGRKNMREGSR